MIEKIKTILSDDHLRRVSIRAAVGGTFIFEEETYVTEDGYTFWTPTHVSGLYASVQEAERAARLAIPWLRNRISN